jgi:DnaD/phage-associated family protein
MNRKAGEPKATRHFSGFPEGKTAAVALPEPFFTELVPFIDDPDELKVTLLVFWRLAQMRSDVAPWITNDELLADEIVKKALGDRNFAARLKAALARAVNRGSLLVESWQRADGEIEVRYFANSPRGRAAVDAMRRGRSPERAATPGERSNIFALYEKNIGPLTAMISEELMEAEETYPDAWIEDAFREAVRQNKRSWSYILAILERWQTEGRHEINRRTSRGTTESDRDAEARRYIEEAYDRIVRR